MYRIAFALVALSVAPAAAADYFWNPAVSSANWTGTTNWGTTIGSYTIVWADGNTANFNGSNQTITLDSNVSLTGINFTGNNITIASGGPAVGLTFGTANFSVSGANQATIAANLFDGTLTKIGTGTLILSGTNTYSGGTNINEGRIELNSAGALGSIGTISFGGGTLRFTANNTTDYSARFSNAVGQLYRLDTNGRTVTLASNLTSVGGSLNKINSGTIVLSGSNQFTGGVAITNGRLMLNNANAIGSTGAIAFDGGTMVFSASNAVDYSARFTHTGSAPYSFDTNGQTVTLSTDLTGTNKGLLKGGSGTLILSGANNTYEGASQILNSTLRVTGQIVNSAVTVTGTVSTIEGTGRGGSSLTLTTGGSVAPGLGVGTMTVGPNGGVSASALTFADGGAYNWQISAATGTAGTGYDRIAVNGGLTVSATSANRFIIRVQSQGAVSDFNPAVAYSWTLVDATNVAVVGFDTTKFTIDTSGFAPNSSGGVFELTELSGDLALMFTPVPEPTTGLLVAVAGLLGLRFRAPGKRQIAGRLR